MTTAIITIPTTGDEQQDFDAIEEAAVPYTAAGYEPTDAEPGEWLILSNGDSSIEIRVAV